MFDTLQIGFMEADNTRSGFSRPHTIIIKVFWGIFISNRRKFNLAFKTQSSARHLGPSLGAPTIRMTSLSFHNVNHNTPARIYRAVRNNITRLDCTRNNNGTNLVEMNE
jgi:hypothetical protein